MAVWTITYLDGQPATEIEAVNFSTEPGLVLFYGTVGQGLGSEVIAAFPTSEIRSIIRQPDLDEEDDG